MIGELQKRIDVPENFVETAKELQFQIAIEEDNNKAVAMAKEALRLLVSEDKPEIAGSNEIIVHTLSAMIIEKVFDSTFQIRKLDDLILRGNIANLSVFVFQPEIPTIFMNIGGAIIKEPIFQEDPSKGRVNGLLRVPVSSVVSIWPAA